MNEIRSDLHSPCTLSSYYRRSVGADEGEGGFGCDLDSLRIGGNKPMVAELAAMCHVSEVYFRRLFKQYAGISPAKYRMNVKINRAKGYLGREHLSIAEISDRLGFSEVSYFIKCFKESTGLTPRQYRRALYEEGKE